MGKLKNSRPVGQKKGGKKGAKNAQNWKNSAAPVSTPHFLTKKGPPGRSKTRCSHGNFFRKKSPKQGRWARGEFFSQIFLKNELLSWRFLWKKRAMRTVCFWPIIVKIRWILYWPKIYWILFQKHVALMATFLEKKFSKMPTNLKVI